MAAGVVLPVDFEILQLTVLYFLVFLGDELLGLNTDDEKDQTRLDTIVFNSFVMMQVRLIRHIISVH